MSDTYQVIDRQTSNVISTHSTRKLATRKADRLDLQYGAIRYGVRVVFGQSHDILMSNSDADYRP